MSYIFSSNANEYTFRKLDSMLINLPENDGEHMLVRQTIDNVPTYSWKTPNIILKVSSCEQFKYTPNETINKDDYVVQNIELSTSGNYLVTTCMRVYLSSMEEVFNDCSDIEDLVNRNYYIKVKCNDQVILSTIILDSLNPIIDIYYTSLIALTDKNVQISIESNIKCLTFLKDVETLNIIFEQVVV